MQSFRLHLFLTVYKKTIIKLVVIRNLFLDVTADNYDAQFTKYTKIQDSCNKRVDALKAKIDALRVK